MKRLNILYTPVLWAVIMICSLQACNYLDVVPENIPTIDHAFRNRNEAQKYLYGCLSFMPHVGNITEDPALLGADEIWIPEITWIGNTQMRKILIGLQGTESPIANYWSSKRNDQSKLNGGKNLWTGISDCNIFLENIDKPFDLQEVERKKWTGEVLFIKAYLHYWLFRQYGPIPLIKTNNAIDAPAGEVQQYREPVDSVVNYMVTLLDEAATLLPTTVEDPASEMGRPDKCIALALKAQVLTLAASPLFNCNPDYASFKDKRGVQLFPQDKSEEKAKWQRAVTAIKEAIDMAHAGNHRLYDFRTDFPNTSVSDQTALSMQVRGAATERFNPEIIWGNSRTNNNSNLQRMCSPFFTASQRAGGGGTRNYAPTLRTVKQFYTKNGIPIEDDIEWQEKNIYSLRTATTADQYYIKNGYRTIELHYNREPRFYGAILFDGGTFYGNSRITQDNNMWVAEMRSGALNGFTTNDRSSFTGYICKKLAHFRSSIPDNATGGGYTSYNYAFPIIRLADLYLLYAEALNEAKDAPDNEVYEYIDRVRERTGLKGVVESWQLYAVGPKKTLPLTKGGMREIIRRERMNELAFEGARFWDLRRWKMAEEYLNKPIYGLNVQGESPEDFYQETQIFLPQFEKKDYLWPLRVSAMLYNLNLVQNPGW